MCVCVCLFPGNGRLPCIPLFSNMWTLPAFSSTCYSCFAVLTRLMFREITNFMAKMCMCAPELYRMPEVFNSLIPPLGGGKGGVEND